MAMTVIWTGMVCLSVLCALALGRVELLAGAALEGAQSAVELTISMAGPLCLWSGVMEVMGRTGLARRLTALLRPALAWLYPTVKGDGEALDKVAANVSANLLGLGNAATPFGLEAARAMSRYSPGVASDALCMLVVCNSASIQLIPATVAAVRSGAGSAAPFEILPAVWLASGLALGAGLLACKVCASVWRS